MRISSTLLFLCFLIHSGLAQVESRHFEYGTTLITVNALKNSKDNYQERAAAEILNAVFFRFNTKAKAFRFATSYNNYYHAYASPIGSYDGFSGTDQFSDFRIGIGAQALLLKKKDWLYTCLDLYYRHVKSHGTFTCGFRGANETYQSTANGFDCFTGLGFKIKIISQLYLSPEFGFLLMNKAVQKTTVPNTFGITTQVHYTETSLFPQLKCHLIVMF